MPIILFVLSELFFTAVGMGVPFFNILSGFVVGVFLVKRTKTSENYKDIFKRIFQKAVATSAFTFFLMLLLWGPNTIKTFDKNMDFENFGHPLILYDPKLSFIAWLILMIVISPFLQLLTTIFSSFLTITFLNKSRS